MRFQECDIVGDRLFDPREWQTGAPLISALELRLFPGDTAHVRRRGKDQASSGFAPFRNQRVIFRMIDFIV